MAETVQVTCRGKCCAGGLWHAVTAAGACSQPVLTNWGDPLNPTAPCGNYMPIIHITGSATINGQQGQGILLVDGSLSVYGGFQFYGITIVKGSLITAGGGSNPARFCGPTLGQDSASPGPTTSPSGNAHLLFSRCPVQKPRGSAARPSA